MNQWSVLKIIFFLLKEIKKEKAKATYYQGLYEGLLIRNLDDSDGKKRKAIFSHDHTEIMKEFL